MLTTAWNMTFIGTLLGILATSGTVQAGEFGGWNGPHLPSVTGSGDTYAGSVSAATFRHGTYFYIDREAGMGTRQRPRQTSETRILDGRKAQCTYEAGVCVIRP